MNIHVTSCETGPYSVRYTEAIVRRLWVESSRKHALVENSDSADLVFITDLRTEYCLDSLRHHPVVGRCPEKCFLLSDIDEPIPLLHGIYACANETMPFRSRYRSGSYTLVPPQLVNPFVANYREQGYEKPKRYLASFVGRSSSEIRKALFTVPFIREDILLRDTTKEFNLFGRNDPRTLDEAQARFVATLEASKFCLCPRGGGVSSYRLFESMKMGVAPVIMSDGWLLPVGPDWDHCALVVGEWDLKSLEAVLVQNEHRFREMGAAAADGFAKFFAPSSYFDYLVEQAADIVKTQWVSERVLWRMRDWIALWFCIKEIFFRVRNPDAFATPPKP